MQKIAIIAGVLLILLGVFLSFLGAQNGNFHFTALIPSFFGLIIALCGALAQNPARTKAAMHVVVLFALLGVVSPLGMSAKSWPAMLSGNAEGIARPLAVWGQMGMFVICAPLLFACVNWFVANRRARSNG